MPQRKEPAVGARISSRDHPVWWFRAWPAGSPAWWELWLSCSGPGQPPQLRHLLLVSLPTEWSWWWCLTLWDLWGKGRNMWGCFHAGRGHTGIFRNVVFYYDRTSHFSLCGVFVFSSYLERRKFISFLIVFAHVLIAQFCSFNFNWKENTFNDAEFISVIIC